MRPHWKIERTIDTRKNPDGTPKLISETKGWWGKPHLDADSRLLTKEELQAHWGNADDEPITEEDKFWHLVKVLLKLNTEKWTAVDGYDVSGVHRGNIWKEASRVGWDADEAWTMMKHRSISIIAEAQSIIDEECGHLLPIERPQIHKPVAQIPETEITTKVLASHRTHIANGLRSHIAKRGQRIPKKKN